ncbi:hypothetical protein G6F56_004995 [Rhizopus delemar]|uniref:Thioesterase domain-containing protein n=1 Tax=Rhizopus stolonifer TaxID=4846 RepID=A0A367JXY2_RHIST|nr:hypothetical protein G6F56_004995 [Rhizopus delemar]RCH94806.1 hypothetical protein CU098_011289 [Rhizopus stolonifer]
MQIEKKVAEEYPGLKGLVDYFSKSGSEFEQIYEDCLKIVDAESDKVTWEFIIKDKHTNRYGNIHGGLIATLIDVCSSFAIRVNTGAQWKSLGVSTDMAISYMRGAQPGSVLKIVCEAHRVGNKLATLYTRIYDQNNKLCYSGSHTKFCTDSKL